MVTKSESEDKGKMSRNPVKTQRKILKAGIRLFSQRGYDGVSVDEIVNRAGVNKRMLYHYFGNKKGLYVAVLMEVFGRLEKIELEALEKTNSVKQAIDEILTSYSNFLNKNHEFVNLVLWENLNQGRFLKKHPSLLSKNPFVSRLREVLDEGVLNGEIVDGVDARQLLVSLIGLCFVLYANRYSLKHTVGLDYLDPEVLAQGMESARTIVLNGILVRD